MSVLRPVQLCFDYCSFTVSFQLWVSFIYFTYLIVAHTSSAALEAVARVNIFALLLILGGQLSASSWSIMITGLLVFVIDTVCHVEEITFYFSLTSFLL